MVQTEGCRSKGQCHAVVLVGVNANRLFALGATFTIPLELTVVLVMDDETQFAHLRLQRFYAVRLFDFQR